MAEQDCTIELPKKKEWLSDLFSRTLWPMDGLINTLDGDHNAHEDLLAVLIPLIEHLKSDLEVIEQVLSKAFGGDIMVEFAEYPDAWRALTLDNFKKSLCRF